MRVAVEATSAAPGGGLSFLRHALPAVAAALPSASFDVFVGPAASRETFGAHTRTIETGPFKGWAHRIAWVQRTFPRLARDYDVVLATGNFAPLGCARKTVLYVQNAHVLPQQAWRHEYFTPKRVLQRLLGRLSIRNVGALFFISDAVKRWGRPFWRGRSIEPGVAHPGVTLGERVDHVAGPGRDVIAVGNIVPHKQLDRTVRIAAGVARALGPVRLRIAGGETTPGARARLEEIARREGIGSHVDFLGFVEAGALGRLYATHACYLSNSALEAFPLPPLEALAAGLAVAVPDSDPFREVCGDAADYFAADDEAAAVAAVCRILTSSDGDDDRSARARARAGRFSWSRFGALVSGAIATTADGAGSGAR